MRKNVLLTTTLFVFSSAAIGQAAAQDTTSAGVAEVVITAQKRSENLQDTPLAVTALSADSLAAAGVKGFVDINKVAPDVTVNNVVGATNIAIRGVRASSLGPTAETPTAVHIDGAFLSRQTGLSGMFYDLERVEVLKGPQGTLYGRNATGGVVNLITKKPGDSFETLLEAEAGNYDLYRLQAAVNMPLSDVFAVRVAGRHYEHDGYYENGLDDAKESSARLSAQWKPTDKFTLLATGDYQLSDRGGPGQAIKEARYRTGGLPPQAIVLPEDPYDQNFLYPAGTSLFKEKSETYGAMLQADYDLDFATLTAQVANRRLELDSIAPTVRREAAPPIAVSPADSNTTSIEVRLASNAKTPVEWVGGLFYFHENSTGDMCQRATLTAAFCTLDIDNPFTNTDAYAAFGQATYTPGILDEKLHVTLGLRYNYETKQAIANLSSVPFNLFYRNGVRTNAAGAPLNPAQTVPGRLADEFSRVTGKVGLAYDLTEDNLVYASYSTGFKAGGFAYGSQPAFEPEYIDAYEIGSKNQFLDRRLQVNLSAYYYDYDGQLRNVQGVPPPAPFSDLTVVNVGANTYKGASIDTIFAVTGADQVSLNLNFQKAKYEKFLIPGKFIAAPPLTPTGAVASGYTVGDFSGSEPPNAADWSGRAGYSHFFQLPSGELEAHVDVQFQSDTQVSDTSFPGTVQYVEEPSYARGDVSLTYAPKDADWRLTGYVNNVTDERSFAQANYVGANPTNPLTAGLVTGNVLPPMTFGVIFSTKFDGQ